MSCKRIWLLILVSVSVFICALPVKADDVDRILGEDGLPITLDQISKYGAKKVYQGIWKAINDSSTSDFVKTKEWKDLHEKPLIEMINDKDVIRAAAILFAKTGDTDGSKYTRDIGEIVGAEKRL